MLTDLKDNRFQKKLMMQDTIYEYSPLQLSTLATPVPVTSKQSCLCFSYRDSNCQLPLHIAASHGLKCNVALLLRENPEHVNVVDCSGRSALLLASQNNFPAMVTYLLSQDADYEVKDKFGLTAFDWAVNSNSPEVVQVFLGTKFWKEVEL